ncbi:hypothetical protein AAHX03_08075 [Klebsiella variicola subsp. variicola]|uniref:hypothetical protein n=1 Tax=Klebsiella variicola TaxID=244366 RepID=UPI0035A21B15
MDFFEIDEDTDLNLLHFKFNDLNKLLGYAGAKEVVSSWGNDFYDRDKKAKKEFQTSFHSTFWELYLHAALKEMNFKVSEKHNRPDFIVESPTEMYIEAVVSEIKKDGTPEKLRTIEDVEANLRPITTRREFSDIIDEAISRHSNSLESKLKKYTGHIKKDNTPVKGYVDCNWVSPKAPYIIALSSHDQIAYGREFIYSMFALLYGQYYDPENKIYTKKNKIKKPGTNSDLDLGIFLNPSFKEVSAVLFCNTLTLGKASSLHKSENINFDTVINIRYLQDEPHFRVHEVTPENPEKLLDGLYIFHNPFAKNKLELGIFNKLAQFSMDEYGPHQIGSYPLLVSRFHTNMLPSSIIPSIKADIFSSYNSEYCMRGNQNERSLLKPAKSESIRKKKKRKNKISKSSRRKNR